MSFRVKITGGPTPASVRIVNAETGERLDGVQSLEIECFPNVDGKRLLKAKLGVFAELDVEAEVEELTEIQRMQVLDEAPSPAEPASPSR